jgi:hypothetical protein
LQGSRHAASGKIRRAPNGAESGVELKRLAEGLLLAAGGERHESLFCVALGGALRGSPRAPSDHHERGESHRPMERNLHIKARVA